MGHFLDIARGAYSRLSPEARARLGGLLQVVPTSLKYGGTYRKWRDHIATAGVDEPYLRAYRDRARIAVVRAAHAHSLYYREMLTALFGTAFRPEHVVHDDAWSRIPVLRSSTVVQQGERLCTVSPDTLDHGSTGGTSGEPVKFYLDRTRSPIELAFVHDVWSRAGYRTGDPRFVMRGVELHDSGGAHMQYDPSLGELRCSIFHLTDDTMRAYRDAIVARRIRYIQGYPSAIAIFASFLVRSGLGPLRDVRGVFPISERFYDAYRDVIARAFDRAAIVPFYGLSEKVAFAPERPGTPDTYDFDPLYGYTELVDDSGHVVTTPGESGRIVSTGLLFRGMPLIRYDTGDTAELVSLPTAGNLHRLGVCAITPKHGHEFFVGRHGTLIPVSAVLQISDEMFGIREFQFYQDRPGEAVLRVVPLPQSTPNFRAYLDLIVRKAQGELDVTLEIVERIATTRRGKRRFIEQRLDIGRVGRALSLAYDVERIE